MSNLVKKEKGFTLIEIVLALAIAGLLLVVVFLAVSGAQKSRRDAQRKDQNAQLMAALETYASNSAGDYSGLTTSNIQNYKPGNFNDPSSGTAYTLTVDTTAPTTSCTLGTVHVLAASRSVTSYMCLEQGTFQKLTNQ